MLVAHVTIAHVICGCEAAMMSNFLVSWEMEAEVRQPSFDAGVAVVL